ncbi:hypothetical protein D9M69_541780 [compost metagenome]
MQQHEVIDVAHVVLGAQLVLHELIQLVQVYVGEELRRQVADRQSEVRRLGREPLVLRHLVEQVAWAAHLVVLPWVVPEHMQGQSSPPGIVDQRA